jgi:hypothetical protein
MKHTKEGSNPQFEHAQQRIHRTTTRITHHSHPGGTAARRKGTDRCQGRKSKVHIPVRLAARPAGCYRAAEHPGWCHGQIIATGRAPGASPKHDCLWFVPRYSTSRGGATGSCWMYGSIGTGSRNGRERAVGSFGPIHASGEPILLESYTPRNAVSGSMFRSITMLHAVDFVPLLVCVVGTNTDFMPFMCDANGMVTLVAAFVLLNLCPVPFMPHLAVLAGKRLKLRFPC